MENSTATIKVRLQEAHVQDAEGNPGLGGRLIADHEFPEGSRQIVDTPMGKLPITVERGMDGFASTSERIGAKGVYVMGARIDWDRLALL